MEEKDLTMLVQSIVAKVTESSASNQQKLFRTDHVSLALARNLIAEVEKKAEEIGVKAVVAVANACGRPIAVECMDDSFMASFDVAMSKAYTVTALKMSTIDLKPLAQPGGSLYGIQFTNDSKIVVFGGGVPLYKDGRVIGGLGVSGGTEEQDTGLAAYGGEVFRKMIG